MAHPRSRNRSGECPKCGTWRRWLHKDHIIPKRKGGTNARENIQYICANCHQDKTYDDNREIRERHTARISRGGDIRAKIDATLKTRRVRSKMRHAHLGRKFTAEHCQRISEARKGCAPTAGSYKPGHAVSKAVRAKISATAKGQRRIGGRFAGHE